MNTKASVAPVTGASSGIGEATAERLAKAGWKVCGTSRRGAQVGQRDFQMLPLDVTSDDSVEAVIRKVIDLVADKHRGVVWAEHEAGTTFRLSVPLTRGEHTELS